LKAGFPTGTQTDPGNASEPKGPAFVPPTPAELAAKFPQLEILELLGRGGMGAVYKARQKQLGRIVALKILPPGIGDEPAFADRFTREARALATLNHPGIVTLYEFGQTNGLFFFLMEFVDGVNLRQLLHRGRIAPREALAIVPQICDALQYAHDQGIVHRDIKPENILLDRKGQVKVADFGVARLMGIDGEVPGAESGQASFASGSLTEAGKVMGTPQYMAPEQKNNPTEVDHRADIYSLGVVFYQMLTGELPGKRIEVPSKKVLLDVRLDEVVLRALENQPGLRYQQASALKTELETIAGGAPSPPPASRSQFAYFWEDVFPGCASSPKYKSRYIRFWEKLFGSVHSCGAISGFHLSLAGFIGFFAFLGIIPGMRWCLPGLGFFPMFGLIGVAYVFEAAARSGVDLSQTCRLPDPNSQRGRWRRRIFWLIVAGIIPAIFLFAMSLLVLGTRGGEKALEAATALEMTVIFAKAIGIALGVSLIVGLWCRVFRKKSVDGVDVWPRHAERLLAFAIFWPVLAVAASVVIWEFSLTARIHNVGANVDWGREVSSLVGNGTSDILVWAIIVWLILSVPGIGIFRKAIAKCAGKPENKPENKALPIQKPDRFWRRFAIFAACLPLVLIAIVVAYLLLSREAKIARAQKAQAFLQSQNAVALGLPEVVVADRAAVVKQRQFNGEGLLFLFGDMTNRWEPKHLDSLFAVTLESHLFGHGADWVIRSAHGNIGYNLETPTGAVTGEIVFHRGTPGRETDGAYVIGEFQPESGHPLPIAVKLAADKPAQPSAIGTK